VAGRHDDLADGDARCGEQVHVLAVLHLPSGGGELLVDADAGALLGSEPVVVHSAPFVHR
jgi:hypothetical protein